ncbi:hypothetical protein K461DRAFT_223131 [Myriangium duriaei CBS 260.36]|uniref:CNH domain-containing protein n=1 Tax=Myriangium duriaei CBS 260.36 TaxID=1168546 RepID=A0A9P4J495_9PEZI|nr:hypothetical protein K461DRAFT_223131 [Myriangium duriaei CBS 260.36]
MLIAFKAQSIIELKQRDKSKIESVLAYGDRVLVGFNTGSLRIYRLNELASSPSDTGDAPSSGDNATEPGKDQKPAHRLTDLLHEEEKFSKRAIQQLAIIKEANVLVALTDNHVSVHDLQTYALQERLDKTRGASTFAVTSNVDKDAETGVPTLVSRMAVAVKRKILLWSWHDMELESDVQEIVLPATVKSLTWVTGIKVMVGMDPGFTLVNIETGDMTDINKPIPPTAESAGPATARFAAVSSSGMGYMGMGGWVPKPMATKLGPGNLLLAKDVNTLFVDEDGAPVEKRQIPWAAAPDTIGYSYPYLLSLQQANKGTMEVRSPDTLTLLQSVQVPNATLLHVPQPNISLAHAGKGFLVASDRTVWRMLATSYESQTEQLVHQSRFDEAISLLTMLEDTLLKDKTGQIREIQMQKAQALFAQQKYRPALDLFTDAAAPPVRVVSRYPKSIAGNVSRIEEPEEISTDGELSENVDKSENSKNIAGEVVQTPKKSKVDKIKSAAKDSDTASIKSVSANNEAASIKTKKKSHLPLQGGDLKQAVMALCSFLAQSRVQIQKYLNFDGTLKDTIASQIAADKDSDPPFRNIIVLVDDLAAGKIDWEKELFAVAKLVDTTLFRAYMYALPSLAGPLFRLDNFCDPDVVEEKLYENGRYNDLIDFLQGKKLHRQALELLLQFGKNEAEEEIMPALRGPSRTVAYLQQLPPEMIDIILEFSKWPLETTPEAGMEIFVADTENAESLPRDRVVAHLSSMSPSLSLKYLEHIINELGDQSANFHQMLVDAYLAEMKSSASSDKVDVDKTKLESFLRQSMSYNKAKTFRQLPSEDPHFYECRAIVLSAMGNHKQALSIYVFQIKDYAKAEQYCNDLYLTSTDSESSAVGQEEIYTILLSLYLRPPQPETINWPPALELLSKHGARLPSSSTLNLVPDHLSVSELHSYFRGRMRRDVAAVNTTRISRGLQEVRHTAADAELIFGQSSPGRVKKALIGRNKRITVRDDDHCRVCLKRFGNSAIRVWPDGEVVHYGCVDGRGRTASGGGGFEGMKKGSWN